MGSHACKLQKNGRHPPFDKIENPSPRMPERGTSRVQHPPCHTTNQGKGEPVRREGLAGYGGYWIKTSAKIT